MEKILSLAGFFLVMVLFCGCMTVSPPAHESLEETEQSTGPQEIQPVSDLRTPSGTGVAPEDKRTDNEALSALDPSFVHEYTIIAERMKNQAPIVMDIGTTTDIWLSGNPTTGFLWNATVSPGLEIVNESYAADTGDRMGSGGDYHWTILATAPGNQTFTAIYKRPWEVDSPKDVTYTERFFVPALA
ncbi:MAG: protease inhibitor I42 family protein [Methanospirillaceae archaeon]|nr:protease inhibitor I42 family protein [Methanospirillaceae archaeon]